MMFQVSFQWVSRVIERTSEEISGKFQRYFKDVSRNFQGCSRIFFRIIQGRLKGVSMEFKWVLKVFIEVQWVFEKSFKCVSRML